MDEFGVLVESIGFRAQGKSAPMAKMKAKRAPENGFPGNLGLNPDAKSAYSGNSINGSFVDDLDGIFRSNRSSQNYDNDDIFGQPFSSLKQNHGADLDSMFNNGSKSSSNVNSDDGFDLFGTAQKPNDSIDDLFGSFGLNSGDSKGNMQEKVLNSDDLIPGFGGSSPSSNGSKSRTNQTRHSSDSAANTSPSSGEDPFSVFESRTSTEDVSSWPFSDPLGLVAPKSSSPSTIDELEEFAKGTAKSGANLQFPTVKNMKEKPNVEAAGSFRIPFGKKDGKFGHKSNEILKERQGEKERNQTDNDRQKGQRINERDRKASGSDDNLESFFGMEPQPSQAKKPATRTEDSMFDALFNEGSGRGSQVKQTSSNFPSSKPKASSVTSMNDDFSLLFGGAMPSSDEFEEVDGESEERRRARLNHHIRTKERMMKALAEKNQRDLQLEEEQQERRRLAETLDNDIKRWAAGKEGNLRALLSSLQQVLWPECGWQPVLLTDLITSVSVKKVYHKATLCVHPDKVQQKGADLRQKYIAEKVFDLLKEAWNKFNAEELR